jgi:probable phosphoglycerate mutase
LERSFGIEAEVMSWMAEIGPADAWEGSPYDELAKELEDANMRTVEELWGGMPGAESFRDFHIRVTDGVRKELAGFGVQPSIDHPGLWDGDPDLSVVLVAHGGTNAVVTGHLLGVEPTPWEWDRFDSAHASVITLVTRPVAQKSAFGLMTFGDVTHLDADMVTR